MGKIAGAIEAVIHWLIGKSIWVTSSILFIMILVVAIDVIGRYAFNHPLKGAMEFDQILMVFLVSLTLGYTTLEKRHITVDVVLSHIHGRARAIVDSIWSFACLAVTTIITWQMISWAWQEMVSEIGRRTLLLNLPEAPFIWVAAFGILLMCLEWWVAFAHSIARVAGGQEKPEKPAEVLTDLA